MKSFLLLGILLGIALAGLVFAALPVNGAKPNRADCIAGAELLWGGEVGDRVPILNEIGNAFSMTRNYPVGGQTVQERERIYVIFTRDCDKKNEMMEKIMRQYKRIIPNFPKYRLIQDVIQPSTNTIYTYGDAWSDGKGPPR